MKAGEERSGESVNGTGGRRQAYRGTATGRLCFGARAGPLQMARPGHSPDVARTVQYWSSMYVDEGRKLCRQTRWLGYVAGGQQGNSQVAIAGIFESTGPRLRAVQCDCVHQPGVVLVS